MLLEQSRIIPKIGLWRAQSGTCRQLRHRQTAASRRRQQQEVTYDFISTPAGQARGCTCKACHNSVMLHGDGEQDRHVLFTQVLQVVGKHAVVHRQPGTYKQQARLSKAWHKQAGRQAGRGVAKG